MIIFVENFLIMSAKYLSFLFFLYFIPSYGQFWENSKSEIEAEEVQDEKNKI